MDFPVIYVQKTCPILRKWLEINNSQNWMVITAWNPSYRGDHFLQDNLRDNQRLFEELRIEQKIVLPAWGMAHNANWPAEASFLVLDVSLEEALDWTKRFGQHACIWGELKEKDGEIECVANLWFVHGCQHVKLLTQAYTETTYVVSPFSLSIPSTLQPWLQGTNSRFVHFSQTPHTSANFQVMYQGGYLGFYQEAPVGTV